MTLLHFTKNFVYQADKRYDQWSIPQLGDDGKFRDDCDGFALGMLYYVIAEESLVTFWKLLITGKAKIHYVDNNGGHAVLQLDGMYIDNWTLDWVTKEHMESLGHKFHKRDYMFYQVALKMLNTKIRGIF